MVGTTNETHRSLAVLALRRQCWRKIHGVDRLARMGEGPVLSELCSRPVTVRILYFAGLRDAVGTSEELLALPPGVTTVAALADHLAARHQAFAQHRGHVRLARNEAFASGDEPIADGDVIALIPPVAGG